MGLERYFFEIGLYWCEESKFNERYTRDLTRHLDEFVVSAGLPRENISRNILMAVEQDFWEHYVAPWYYNQAVGWIRLYTLGSQIRGDLWISSAKRFQRRMRNRHISLRGKVFELPCWPEQSSNEILEAVRRELRQFQGSSQNRSLVLDLACFETVGQFINWRGLVGFESLSA